MPSKSEPDATKNDTLNFWKTESGSNTDLQAAVARSIDLVRDLKATDFAAKPRDAEVTFMSKVVSAFKVEKLFNSIC